MTDVSGGGDIERNTKGEEKVAVQKRGREGSSSKQGHQEHSECVQGQQAVR